MDTKTHLSWKYAGIRVIENNLDHLANDIAHVGVSNAQPVEIQGQKYYVSHGYYVPHYASKLSGEAQFQDRERIVSELKERFFRCAEPNINQMYYQKQIEWLKEQYEKTPSTKLVSWKTASGKEESKTIELTEKRTLGALLVGAIINRSDRLAKAIIEKRRTGEIPDILEIEEGKEIPELEKELKNYLSLLMKNTSLVSCVRRNASQRQIQRRVQEAEAPPRYDHDGVLYEMITEVAKAAVIRLDKHEITEENPSPEPTQDEATHLARDDLRISQGRVEKIGKAMACIDTISTEIETMLRQDAVLSKTTAGSLLKNMGDVAKALTGIKKSEIENYTAALVLYKSLQHDLNRIYFETIDNNPHTNMTLTLVQRGFDLIKDMVETRLPCNEIYWIADSEGKFPSKVRTMPQNTQKEWGDARARLSRFMRDAENRIEELNVNALNPPKPNLTITTSGAEHKKHAGIYAGLTI